MNNNEWQPAVFLPLERMCEFHRALFEAHADAEMRANQQALVGKKILVRVLNNASLDNKRGDAFFPANNCKPLQAKLSDGSIGGIFSCEVQTD